MAALIVEPDDDLLTHLHTAEVNQSDLQDVMGRELTKDEVLFVAEFERSWKTFVCSKRGKLPSGRREAHLKHLQQKVNQLTTTRNNVEEELNKQLAFFHDSQDSTEKELKTKIQYENDEYKKTEEQLQKELEDVLDAQNLQEETLPWTFFLSSVDTDAAATLDDVDLERSRTVKPSNRAMYLTYSTAGDSQNMLLRAFQIDYAILKAQSTLLNKQIERYEKTTASQERAGVFLMENNVWSILNYTVEPPDS